MAFKLHSRLHGSAAPLEYRLGTDAEAYSVGEALVLAAGRLTKCGATTKPEFICQKAQVAEATASTPIPVMRVTDEQKWETVFSATPSGVVAGDKVTVSSDGLFVTGTEASGVFTVDEMAGTASGSVVRGYFH